MGKSDRASRDPEGESEPSFQGWIESHDSEGAVKDRLTDQGLAAKTAPVKL
jgi:hypothetical protein